MKKVWKKAIAASELAVGEKGCVQFGQHFIALVHFSEQQWYAVQNVCPHQQQNVISRGIIGDHQGEPKIVCPMHKNGFSLLTGQHLGGNENLSLQTFPIKMEGEHVFVQIEET